MANSDWFFVFPEVTLGAKKNLEAESVTWLLRLTITYYSSCVQQKQRKEKKEEKHEIIKKQNMKSKKSRELPRHHRQKTAKKHKNKTKRCDRSSKQLFIHTTNKTRKTNKQTNKTHLQQYYTLKTIERRLCLLGFVLIFCLCISEKFNQVSFKCHPWRSSPPLKNKKQKKKTSSNCMTYEKKKSRKRKLFHWFHHLSSYAFLWKEKKNFSSPYIYLKRNKWRNFLQNYEKE